MPSGRRTSAPCTTTSPSHDVLGPGGAEVEFCSPRNSARVAPGSTPRCLAICPLANLSKLNAALVIPRKNVAGFSEAVADRCATMSRTVQPAQSDAVSHCAGVRSARSLASAPRSAAMVAQMSDMANSLELVSLAAEVVAAALHEGIDPPRPD